MSMLLEDDTCIDDDDDELFAELPNNMAVYFEILEQKRDTKQLTISNDEDGNMINGPPMQVIVFIWVIFADLLILITRTLGLLAQWFTGIKIFME